MAFKAIIEEGGLYQEVWIVKYRSKGVKPYSEPLAYDMRETEVKARLINGTKGVGPAGTLDKQITYKEHNRCEAFPFISNNDKNAVHNKALSKVSDQLEYVSNLFEAWYERKEAYSLLGDCLKAIRTFTKRWKDPKYWRHMRKTYKTNIKDPSSLPQAWLLWNFALKPLIGTIDDVMKLLCQDMPVFWIEGTSATKGNIRLSSLRTVKVSDKNWKGPSRVQVGEDHYGQFTYLVKHGVRVTSLNPNKQLLNILGLTTPFSSVLSVVPWFWAVNYFVNINAMVSNLEVRFPGINIDKSYTTVLRKCVYDGFIYELSFSDTLLNADGSSAYNPLEKTSVNVQHVHMIRTVSNQVPTNKLVLSYPSLGSNQFANLTSAIALAMKGASEKK